jgi:hypothetical protein
MQLGNDSEKFEFKMKTLMKALQLIKMKKLAFKTKETLRI